MAFDQPDPIAQILEQLMSDAEEEVEEISQPVVASLLSQVSKLVEKLTLRFDDFRTVFLEGLDRKIGERISTYPKTSEKVAGAAIDSTWPPDGGIELVGGHLIGVVAGYYIFNAKQVSGLRRRGVAAKLFFVDSEEARKKIPLAAKLLEKKVGIKLLGLVSDGKLDITLLLLDGEIVPYQLLFKGNQVIANRRLLYRLDMAVSRLLELARKNNIIVVGVVKRSYSHLTSVLHGRILPLNDKALMSIVLRRQEYMVLGKFRDILPAYAKILASSGRAPSQLPEAVVERLSTRPEYGEIVVAFYKPSMTTSYNHAVRIEVYGASSEDELEHVISLLDSMTNPATGLPAPVDFIDEYIRFESRSLELVRRRIVSELATRLGPVVLTLLSHTNPEKRYLYEPKRRM